MILHSHTYIHKRWHTHLLTHANPRWKKFFVWPEFRITPIFTTHFCQILPEPWEILRIYAPSGYIHGTDPCVRGHVINLLLFGSQLTFFSHIFQNFLWSPFSFFCTSPHFFTPPKNFFTPLYKFSPSKNFLPPC